MHLTPRLLLAPLLFAGLAAASCSSSREEPPTYGERQNIRSDGQAHANQAADKGASDLEQATAAPAK